MHGYTWGYRAMPKTGGFACLNYMDSPLGFWLMLGLMVLVTVAIVLLVVSIRKKKYLINDESEAVAIIKRRYAKGELSVEEFKRMKKDLQ